MRAELINDDITTSIKLIFIKFLILLNFLIIWMMKFSVFTNIILYFPFLSSRGQGGFIHIRKMGDYVRLPSWLNCDRRGIG